MKKHNREQKHDVLIRDLSSLRLCFVSGGRQIYGINRTKPGQVVLDENVYLGNYQGYFTKTVAYVKQRKDDQPYYEAMKCQSKEFMEHHLDSIIPLLRNIISNIGK